MWRNPYGNGDTVRDHCRRAIMEPEETVIVRVDSTKGLHYWFTDRRLVSQHEGGVHELLRYQSVSKAHWMLKDLRVKWPQSKEAGIQFKRDHFDRLEIESHGRLIVLDGLDQAYHPVLHFFWWMLGRPTLRLGRRSIADWRVHEMPYVLHKIVVISVLRAGAALRLAATHSTV
jgi:hypothetical protein